MYYIFLTCTLPSLFWNLEPAIYIYIYMYICFPYTPTVTCPDPVEQNKTVFRYVKGDTLIISCLEGYSLPEGEVESVCGSDGSWSPDPSDYQCAPQVENQGTYTAGYSVRYTNCMIRVVSLQTPKTK